MRDTAAPGATTRRILRPTVIGLVVATALGGPLAYHSASSWARTPTEAHSQGAPGVVPRSASSPAPSIDQVPRGVLGGETTEDDGAVTEEDGALPNGTTVFDDAYPGIAGLEPDLLQALRDSSRDAGEDGIELYVSSGWRSRDYQDQLLREAVSKYGSVKEAARWVATADTSPHVSGKAVDIEPFDASAWLSEHGAPYGLCQIYRNEPWHFELRPHAVERGCPRMYADPTQDPRME